jgi:phage terminase large subunit
MKINFYDNPWFPETLRLEMESLKARDPQSYAQVWEGICRQTIDGAIFANEMTQAAADNRITTVPYDATKPVHAVCDLGWSDATAWWFVQFVGMETRLIRYFEDSQRTMTSYLAQLQTYGYVYDTIWLPHDAQSKTLAAAGRSIEDIVRAAGYKTQILDRVPVVDSINAARTIFPNCYFDRDNCADGLNCLRHYRYDVDRETGQFSRSPVHDHNSHGADAFRYIALMIKEPAKLRKRPIVNHAGGWMS